MEISGGSDGFVTGVLKRVSAGFYVVEDWRKNRVEVGQPRVPLTLPPIGSNVTVHGLLTKEANGNPIHIAPHHIQVIINPPEGYDPCSCVDPTGMSVSPGCERHKEWVSLGSVTGVLTIIGCDRYVVDPARNSRVFVVPTLKDEALSWPESGSRIALHGLLARNWKGDPVLIRPNEIAVLPAPDEWAGAFPGTPDA